MTEKVDLLDIVTAQHEVLGIHQSVLEKHDVILNIRGDVIEAILDRIGWLEDRVLKLEGKP